MSSVRSPNGGGINTRLGGSRSNLSEKQQSDTGANITFRNKQKTTDDRETIKNELSEIRKQMSEMMAILTSTRNDQTDSINKLCQDVTSIKNEVSNISHTIETIIMENNSLKCKLASMTTITENTKKKVELLEADFNNLKRTSPGASSREAPITYDDFLSEFHDRNMRKNNIIVVGLPESKTKSTTERYEEEKVEIEKILKSIYSDCPQPGKIIRLGKFSADRTRAIKVCFASEEVAKAILRNKNCLKDDHVKIFSDQTPHQRKHMQNLVRELDKRTADGELNLIIKYIKGIPKIVTSSEKKAPSITNTKN